MYLDRLEIAGFKSFAQKVSFTFNRGITAVVGPNGSGKSNLADAIRWVLGEQSMKSLRGKKSEDVIFSGSEKSARLGFAEVALTLNNEDGQAPIDYSELTVSRKVYRSGEGEYLLNRQASRLTDITMLLARLHLGSRTYSVIGQGMVDAILALSPFERKDFFDEAAGVKPYELKREEALRKLEASGENLKLALVQLTELTPRVRYLTRQVRRLERRDEIVRELRALLEGHYGAEWKKLQEEIARLQGRGQEQRRAKEGLQEEVGRLQQEMSALTRESAHAASFDQLQKEYQKSLQEKTHLKEEEVNIKMRVAVRSREHLKTAVPLSIVREAHMKLARLREEYTLLVKRLQGARHEEDVNAITQKLVQLIERFQTVEAVFDPYLRIEADNDIQASLNEVEKKVETVDARLAALQGELEKLAATEKQEREKIWQVQQKLQHEQQKLNDAVAVENATRVEAARFETRRDDIAREAQEEFEKYGGAADLDALAAKSQGGADPAEIHRLKHHLEQIGGIDPEVEKEYQEISARHTFLETHVEDLKKAIGDLEIVIAELDTTIAVQFTASFKQIDEGFQRFFKTLFGGGRSRLVLVKEVREKEIEGDDVEEEGGEAAQTRSEEIDDPVKKFLDKHKRKDHIGVEIHATPPGKRLSSVNALSGGERALTSIALIASIIANNPAPFVVLDEVDAALDEANSLRFSAILEELSGKTQFVVITHNRATMEKADILYGVTMGEDGISKVLSLKLEDAVKHGNR